jgi:hypothetical protein
MPQVLTVTQNEGESNEEFAGRISEQVNLFFNESTEPAPESTDETSSEPTDVSAAPEEEPAPSS